ncbi:MAG: hypothetical protein KGZ58_04775 [Ignavibacteriales bacterium]|nr:hypothetical protein [Ignavibacteriales bacterium]
MKYLLFISFPNGLMHNALYENLFIVQDSIVQLAEEDGYKIDVDNIPLTSKFEEHFKQNDDFFFELTTGVWFHLQQLSERNHIKPTKWD